MGADPVDKVVRRGFGKLTRVPKSDCPVDCEGNAYEAQAALTDILPKCLPAGGRMSSGSCNRQESTDWSCGKGQSLHSQDLGM